MMGFVQRRIAMMMRANPMKNSLPDSGESICFSSSNDAPAQNVPAPSLRTTTTLQAGCLLTAAMRFAISFRIAAGSELLFGW